MPPQFGKQSTLSSRALMRTFRNRVRDYVAAVSAAVLNSTVAGRRVEVLPNDVFLVSYPRSGNTWIRFLIGNLACPDDPVTFANIEIGRASCRERVEY